MKKPVELTVNARRVSAEIEPRLQLADFLREHLSLTGTHLGCEHGVCGACTVEIDGAPARSCITYAVACDGAHVRTIEGYDGDAVMSDLREAFSAEHALQCGYCTPGMLVTARDIVLRLPQADEARIRKELAGNLCRCTGYVGIVRAIQSVISARNGFSPPEEPTQHSLASATGERVRVRGQEPAIAEKHSSTPASAAQQKESRTSVAARPTRAAPETTLRQSFSVDHAREKVWAFFGRLEDVTTCLPGTSLLGTPTDDHVEMKLRIKLGPIAPEFAGAADVVRDPSTYSGTIRGSARDTRSSSSTRGEIRYALVEEKGGAATRVDIEVGYTLTGALAQFSRSGIVQDIAKRMTAAFAQNVEARLNQRESGASADHAREAPVTEIDAGSLFMSALWHRIKNFFRS